MALRCLLFTSDGGTADPILQVLAGLGVEGEHCSDAVATVEKVTQQNFQVVIIDWDQQPEAALLLAAARERKAAERPLTLAIVSNDVSVPQALQAGANSILRKPIMVSQAKDTLTTAYDLLRSKQESAANAAAAGASSLGGSSSGGSGFSGSAGQAASLPASMAPPKDRTLRAGEFLHSAGSAPGGDFVTGSEVHESLVTTSTEPVDPLHDLEPMAASMTAATEPKKEESAPDSPPQPSETKGLEWFLKTRAVKSHQVAEQAPAPVATSAPAKPELLGYDVAPANSPPAKHSNHLRRGFVGEAKSDPNSLAEPKHETTHEPKHEPEHEQRHEQKKEAELFAYISGEKGESEESPRAPFRYKGAIIGALVLASFAIVAAPQAPWHSKIGAAWVRGRQGLHAWLNPQLVTTPQAPAAHEDFARAGDEYKLPVTENIPDATTDPSQIRVVPVVDPTIKKSNPEGENALQPPADTDGTVATPIGQTPASTSTGTPTSSSPDSQVPSSTPETGQPNSLPPAVVTSTSPATPVGSTAAVPAVTAPPHVAPPQVSPAHSDPFVPESPSSSSSPVSSSVSSVPPRPAPPRDPQPHSAPAQGNVPSSLKSQMASTTPDPGGTKSPEAAMRSIEPVTVPEFTERALLTEQPALEYPVSAQGQQGTVVLQVLIGRDGTVQDAKFLQGSLAFARAAIDGVKLWKFKPYAMNGRAVSVQTLMTMSFKP
jgi:periplasmic protein TonB